MEQRQLIDLLNDMSLEEKAGQLFQVTGDWFDGTEALEGRRRRRLPGSGEDTAIWLVLCWGSMEQPI